MEFESFDAAGGYGSGMRMGKVRVVVYDRGGQAKTVRAAITGSPRRIKATDARYSLLLVRITPAGRN